MRTLKIVVVLSSLMVAIAAATGETKPCVNDAPSPYQRVDDWARLPRPLGEGNSIFVDRKDHIWVLDRCDASCSGSSFNPIWEFDSSGKVLRNFGAGMFLGPHGLWLDKDGNIYVADREIKDGKGMTVTKLSPEGKVLLILGTPGKKGSALDQFDSPSAVVVAPNGDIFVGDGHRTGAEGQPQFFGNARIMKFDKNGKFIKTFGHLGTGPGEIMQPHGLALDSQGRLFVADRSNNRLDIFDQDGNFLAIWTQFGRPSSVWIDKNDIIYVTDSQSEETTAKLSMYYPPNPGCRHGIRIGSAKTGEVKYYIPHPKVAPEIVDAIAKRHEPALPGDWSDIEGVAVDSHGTIYGEAVTARKLYKFVKH